MTYQIAMAIGRDAATIRAIGRPHSVEQSDWNVAAALARSTGKGVYHVPNCGT